MVESRKGNNRKEKNLESHGSLQALLSPDVSPTASSQGFSEASSTNVVSFTVFSDSV